MDAEASFIKTASASGSKKFLVMVIEAIVDFCIDSF